MWLRRGLQTSQGYTTGEKMSARAHGHPLRECYSWIWRGQTSSDSGACVCVRIGVLCFAWSSHPKKAFSNDRSVPLFPKLPHSSCFLSLFCSPWGPCTKRDILLLHPTLQSCDVGPSESPCSAGQCFKGSGNRFPSQEPASKLESSVVWFGFRSSLQRTRSANLYIHVSINSNRCTFNM